MDAVLDEVSIVDRCVWYVNQANLIYIKHNLKHDESSLESVVGNPPTFLWLGLCRFG